MPIPPFNLAVSDSSRLAADAKVFADLGNQFSSPFAVGRGASSDARNDRKSNADQAATSGGAPGPNWPLIVGIGAGALLLGVILLKKL